MINGAEERERVASLVHDIWVNWMRYFQKRVRWKEGVGWVIPEEMIIRWQRQMRTAYADLSEEEKESDRHQADKIIELWAELDLATTEPYGVDFVEPETQFRTVPQIMEHYLPGKKPLVKRLLDDFRKRLQGQQG